MKHNTLLSFLFALLPFVAQAQTVQILDSNIRTVQVVAGTRWTEMPVISLNSRDLQDILHISFDDMQHNYRRFSYRLQHCSYDWTPSDGLVESDYIEGFYNGLTIDDITESINTQMLYTHYRLSLPNDQCRLKMSGNYILTVFDDNNDEEVFRLGFMVVEDKAQLAMNVSGNTDVDFQKTHQQVSMTLRYNGISPTIPQEQLKTVVLQNKQWSSARWNPQWQYNTTEGLGWDHCPSLIFDGVNEYHKYEILSVSHTTFGIDYIHWDGSNYHVFPFPATVSRNYSYDEDADGAFYIRKSDNYENDYATEYVYVHYRFLCPERLPGHLFIDGDFTYGRFDQDYNMMTYNEKDKCYEAVILQKQGYYNYTIMQQMAGTGMRHLPEDGNFHETQNAYQAFVYYKAPADRAYRLVGYCQTSSK
ncbi:MAG: DUF5103 domain-containing protein [Bacteroidaceae bacterium]|nr:DUF5103 domain-containing protein [Bacteroidaceae bacterium]